MCTQPCLGWAEIKVPVLVFMENRKARRLSQEQRERLNVRVTALRVPIFAFKRTLHPTDDFIPLVSDVCWVPDILDATLTGGDEPFAALVEGLNDRLPQLSAEICRKRAEQIASILPWDEATPDSLELATAWFTCRWCNVALRHQEVFKHMCFRTRPAEVTRPRTHLIEFTGNPWAWPAERLLFAEGISKATGSIVLACGGDPNKMTYRELDRIPCRIAWFQGTLGLQVIDWRQLVRFLRAGTNYNSPAFLNRHENSKPSTRGKRRARKWKNQNGGFSNRMNSQSFANVKLLRRRNSGRACTVGGPVIWYPSEEGKPSARSRRILQPRKGSVSSFTPSLTSLISHSIEVVTDMDYYREVRNRRDVDFYREPQPADKGEIADAVVGELAED